MLDRTKNILTIQNVTEQIAIASGNLASVGRALGVTRQAVHAFVNSRPTLLAVCKDAREAILDDAETSLQKAVKQGEAWAVCFLLKTQGRKRGYIERQEMRHGGSIKLVVKERVIPKREHHRENGRPLPGPS